MATWVRRATAIRPLALTSSMRQPIPVSSTNDSRGRRHKSQTFKQAVKLLETLQSNKQVTNLVSSRRDANHRAIPEMLDWLRRAGYTPTDFADRLKFIHVAGTKGKGSVCAFVETILLQYRGDDTRDKVRKRIGKIGLFTSPHLQTVNERIRIDGIRISEAKFARYFFELWDRFDANPPPESTFNACSGKPAFFRFLTILALHTFAQEGVETAIIECGIGGEYDSTNILPPQAVTATGITRLGIDHVGMLGDTLEEIAWHKGGIMKRGVAALSVKQSLSAMAVLEQRASEKSVDLQVIERSPALEDIRLGLAGDFQKDNAALAVKLATHHLGQLGIYEGVPTASGSEYLSDNITSGLENTTLPGRCQIIEAGNITWFLDGAHTTDSIREAAVWFRAHLIARFHSQPPTATMLIFNQTERDGGALLTELLERLQVPSPISPSFFVKPASHTFSSIYGLKMFTYAAFPTNTPFQNQCSVAVDIRAQRWLAGLYQDIERNPLHMAYATIEEAVLLAQRISAGDERVLVLVTGSLYLVGGVLTVLESQAKKRTQRSK